MRRNKSVTIFVEVLKQFQKSEWASEGRISQDRNYFKLFLSQYRNYVSQDTKCKCKNCHRLHIKLNLPNKMEKLHVAIQKSIDFFQLVLIYFISKITF